MRDPRLIPWRRIALLGIAAAAFVPLHAGSATGGALVLISSRAEAYELALDRLSRELKTAGLVVSVARTGENRRDGLLNRGQFRAVAVLGPEALTEVMQSRVNVPIVAGMVLRSTVAGVRGTGEKLSGVAVVDVPFEALLQNLRRVYPKVKRVGVLRNPSRADPAAAELEAAGRQFNLTVAAGDAANPQSLVTMYSTLARTSEAIICFPDASLYNATTIQALVTASIRAKVPIIGFSEGFVRAGALLSVYPDYEVVGSQTAAALLAALAGHSSRAEWSVKTYRVAVNSRIVRLVDFDYDASANRFLTIIQ